MVSLTNSIAILVRNQFVVVLSEKVPDTEQEVEGAGFFIQFFYLPEELSEAASHIAGDESEGGSVS